MARELSYQVCQKRRRKVDFWSCFCLYLTLCRWSHPINVVDYQSHLHQRCHPASVATKELPISPRFLPTSFYRDASSALLHLVNQLLKFYLPTFSRFPVATSTETRMKEFVPSRFELTKSALNYGISTLIHWSTRTGFLLRLNRRLLRTGALS